MLFLFSFSDIFICRFGIRLVILIYLGAVTAAKVLQLSGGCDFFVKYKDPLAIDEKADNYHSELARYRFAQFVETDWYYLLYVPVFNVLLIYIIGSYALSGITYPYQNALIRESLDRGNAAKFGDEFAHFIQSFVYTLGV